MRFWFEELPERTKKIVSDELLLIAICCPKIRDPIEYQQNRLEYFRNKLFKNKRAAKNWLWWKVFSKAEKAREWRKKNLNK